MSTSATKPSARAKTDEEVALIAEASRIVSETLAMLRGEVRPGMTTRRLDAMAEEFIRSQGAIPAFKGHEVHGQLFPATLCTSVGSAVVHGLPDDEELREGEIVSLDCGVKREGFYGDSATTVAVGAVGELEEKLMRVTREALDLGVEAAVAGNRVYDISRAVQRHVESNGFSIVRELVGHGIGRQLHEEPAIPNFVPSPFQRHQFRNTQLVDGMVICIEPMVNAGSHRVVTREDNWTVATMDGQPSAHFEHTIVVREGAPQVLTAHRS
ncbi:MAG TPA: type I methionyl aminopeptidase [Candidatus Kapabacteria bacterium]|jgi:methionyl aminopeptidase|nr:type I methionyl aminopeptidase [Candidatus Kapabacteria bacterium]